MTVKVPGIYYVSVMFGVTKKAWYLHLRKNGVYIASVQKDYNAGYEDSLNLHAIGPVPYLIGVSCDYARSLATLCTISKDTSETISFT